MIGLAVVVLGIIMLEAGGCKLIYTDLRDDVQIELSDEANDEPTDTKKEEGTK